MKHISTSIQETEKIATAFLSTVIPHQEHATVIALHGNLGAGKTAFTQAVAKILGIPDHVTSPTFIIQKSYPIIFKSYKKLVHIDAYRLESSSELENLDWKATIENPENLIFIEWPEKVADILPVYTENIYFTFINETTRAIEVL